MHKMIIVSLMCIMTVRMMFIGDNSPFITTEIIINMIMAKNNITCVNNGRRDMVITYIR